jgi:hypothetical protein
MPRRASTSLIIAAMNLFGKSIPVNTQGFGRSCDIAAVFLHNFRDEATLEIVYGFGKKDSFFDHVPAEGFKAFFESRLWRNPVMRHFLTPVLLPGIDHFYVMFVELILQLLRHAVNCNFGSGEKVRGKDGTGKKIIPDRKRYHGGNEDRCNGPTPE